MNCPNKCFGIYHDLLHIEDMQQVSYGDNICKNVFLWQGGREGGLKATWLAELGRSGNDPFCSQRNEKKQQAQAEKQEEERRHWIKLAPNKTFLEIIDLCMNQDA